MEKKNVGSDDAARVRIVVELERPSAGSLKGQDRGETYRRLKAGHVGQREALLTWLEREGLGKEVFEVAPATAFQYLFLTTTSSVAERLKKAPGVLRVSESGEVDTDLLESDSG